MEYNKIMQRQIPIAKIFFSKNNSNIHCILFIKALILTQKTKKGIYEKC